MNKSLCLVTGACGFMGTHMVELLHRTGFSVRATDLPSAFRQDDRKRGLFPSVIKGLGVEFVGADLTRKEEIGPLVKDAQIVFHIAGLFRYSASWESLEAVNVRASENLLEAALATGTLKRFIMWGAGGVYGIPTSDMLPLREDLPTNPPNDYLRSKDQAEKRITERCEKAQLPFAVLRPTTVYGPRAVYGGGQLVMGMAKMNPAMVPANLTGRVPLVHVCDVVGAALHLAKKGDDIKGAYNINDDSSMTQVELVRFFAKLMGHVFIKLPAVPIQLIMKSLERVAAAVQYLARDVLGLPSPVEADMLALSMGDFVYDNQKLKNTGYNFIYPDPRPGLRDTVQWYRHQGWM